MFLATARYFSKDPKTDSRARSFLAAMGSEATLKVVPSTPGPDLRVVR